MASRFTISPLQASTKGQMKRLRQAGFVPVSMQHKGSPTLHFQQEAGPLDAYIRQHGDAALLDLVVAPGGGHHRAIVQDVQRDPITQKLLQVTFQQIRQDDTLNTHVSLEFVGEPDGVSRHEAMLQHRVNRLDIVCDQNHLPDHITVNIAHLQLGDVVRVSDLPTSPHYKILTPADTVLASLTHYRTGIVDAEPTAAVPVEA